MSDKTPFDALIPAEMARKAEEVGVAKANQALTPLFLLAVLAGAFIAMGAMFATVVTAGGALPFGLARMVGGLVFCLGLILVVIAGAELFTGNNLIIMALASGRISPAKLLRNWCTVYLGNFAGAFATAVLVVVSGHLRLGQGMVEQNAIKIAAAKVQLPFGEAIALGILCNALVCLAVWLCLGARSTADKVLAILFPIAAFVAGGFEHSVANMYFIPVGLMVTAAEPSLTWQAFFLSNLLPVTIGNILGGSVLVGLVYWTIYLRPHRHHPGKN